MSCSTLLVCPGMHIKRAYAQVLIRRDMWCKAYGICGVEANGDDDDDSPHMARIQEDAAW